MLRLYIVAVVVFIVTLFALNCGIVDAEEDMVLGEPIIYSEPVVKNVDWYLIAGFNGSPASYDEICSPSIIWYYDTMTDIWQAWWPGIEDSVFAAVPGLLHGWTIEHMYAERGYWIACTS